MSLLTRSAPPTDEMAVATRTNLALDKSGAPRPGFEGWPLLMGEGNLASLPRFSVTAAVLGVGGSAFIAALNVLATGDNAVLIAAWVFAVIAGLIACAGFIRFATAGWLIGAAALLTGAGQVVTGHEDAVLMGTGLMSRLFLLAVFLIPMLTAARGIENRSSGRRRRMAWATETVLLVLAPVALALWVPGWPTAGRLAIALFGLGFAAVGVKKFLGAQVRQSAVAAFAPDRELEPVPAAAGGRRRPPRPAQVDEPAPVPREDVQDVLAELDKYPGLGAVKKQMRELVDLLKTNQARRDAGLQSDTDFGHITFAGPPGTGKTEMARLVARVLAATGVIEKGHLVEVSRADLVGEYQGHTARAVEAIFEQALGGVLFVDEAYSLFGGKHDAFGVEALTTLLALLENHRGKIVVIFAGYEKEMAALMTANPGLSSRIERTLTFPAYEPSELLEIAEKFAFDKGYVWTADARVTLLERLTTLNSERDEHWGNAREVRRVFNGAVRAHGVRLAASSGTATREDLEALNSSDVEAAVEVFIQARDAERRGRAASAPKSAFEWQR